MRLRHSPDRILGADLAQLVFLLGLETQRSDVEEHQRDNSAGPGMLEAPGRDPVAAPRWTRSALEWHKRQPAPDQCG